MNLIYMLYFCCSPPGPMQQPWKKPKQKAIAPWNPVMQTRLFPPIATRTEWRGTEHPPPTPAWWSFCLVTFPTQTQPHNNQAGNIMRQRRLSQPFKASWGGKRGELGRAERIWGWRTDRMGKEIPSSVLISTCTAPRARIKIVLKKQKKIYLKWLKGTWEYQLVGFSYHTTPPKKNQTWKKQQCF